ncbi:hypothetical protein ABTC44_13315 [Acinetobacter baumannii]|nr:hypothetical protein [Acinetobacter baumannii]
MEINALEIKTLSDEELNVLKAKAKSLMTRTVKYMVQKQTIDFKKRMDHLIEDSLFFMNVYLEINGADMTEQELEEAYWDNVRAMEIANGLHTN